jgi:hypothetical protein
MFYKLILTAFPAILFILFNSISFASDLFAIQTPSTGYQPQMHASGDVIYYVWHEYDGPNRQIFTGGMKTDDATGWKASKRTFGPYDKVFPQLQLLGNKIHYVRQQPDAGKNRQIWTMEMNPDGTGWKEVQRTNTPFDKQFPQLQAAGNKIWYTWNESDGKNRQIWTAEMNADGTGWSAARRTSSPFEKFEPQLQVEGEKIYFVWRESDRTHFQIWTAEMNHDGTGWQARKRTSSPFDKHNPQFQVNGEKIYYAWHEGDGSDFRKARYQVWTAQMGKDGSNWKATQRTTTPFDKYTPQLRVAGNRIFYVWEESDGKFRQIWTAVENKGATGWRSEKRTKSSYGKYDPQLQIVGKRIFYVWHEDHGPTEPIWVAAEMVVR